MKEIKTLEINKSEFKRFSISTETINQLFDINVNKCEKVVTSVS